MTTFTQAFMPTGWRKLLAVTIASQNTPLPVIGADECLLFTNTQSFPAFVEFFDATGAAGVALTATDAAGYIVLGNSQVTYTPPENARSFMAVISLGGSVTLQVAQGRGA